MYPHGKGVLLNLLMLASLMGNYFWLIRRGRLSVYYFFHFFFCFSGFFPSFFSFFFFFLFVFFFV